MHGRLPWLAPADLDVDQARLYESIVGSPRSSTSRPSPLTDEQGRLHGPFNALLLDPIVGEAVQAVGSALRFSTDLDSRMREIAILTTAASARSEYEWHIHAAIGKGLGLDDSDLERIRLGLEPRSCSPDEQLVWQLASELVSRGDLDDHLFELAKSTIGLRRLMDLVVLVGYYELLSRSVRVWRTPLPDGAVTSFPDEAV
jgi:alkylhydroperoxidase family enzyme